MVETLLQASLAAVVDVVVEVDVAVVLSLNHLN
jgi:hypothetical protein